MGTDDGVTNEAALWQWVEANDPVLYAGLAYCCTAGDMRNTLNAATGLSYLPGDDMDNALARYLDALKAQKVSRLTAPSH